MRVQAPDGEGFPVTTRRIVDADAARAEAEDALGSPSAVWRRGDDSLTGYGVAVRLVLTGPERLRDAAEAWRALAARASVDDEVRSPGSGLVAFGAFAFADASAAESVLLVPRVLIGQRDGSDFLTRVDRVASSGTLSSAERARSGNPFPPEAYAAAVEEAVRRIRAGALDKVVLARDLPIEPTTGLDAALDALTARYREAWVFAVDGFFGASPETLVTVREGRFGSRVLAGTAQRVADEEQDVAARDALLGSEKNRFEHALAVDSLLLTLGDLVEDLVIGRPFALGLPNVWHLATDAVARIRPGIGALDLAASLHPTAAVAGAPRSTALATIADLEPFDRRRYAGPVGWIDASGDGEWAVGLRSAETESDGRIRAYAGAGVVAGSEAAQELLETGWKLLPVVEAVGADPALTGAAAPRAGSVPAPAR